MKIVFNVLSIVLCIMLVFSMFAFFTGRENMHLSTILDSVQSIEPIDENWVDVLYWDIELDDNSLLQGFVDFVNTVLIPPVRALCIIGTGFVNSVYLIGYIITMFMA